MRQIPDFKNILEMLCNPVTFVRKQQKMKKIIGFALLLALAACNKEDLPTPTGDKGSFNTIHKMVSGYTLVSAGKTVVITDDKVRFDGDDGQKYEFQIEQVSGRQDNKPAAEYRGEGYTMGVLLIVEDPPRFFIECYKNAYLISGQYQLK